MAALTASAQSVLAFSAVKSLPLQVSSRSSSLAGRGLARALTVRHPAAVRWSPLRATPAAMSEEDGGREVYVKQVKDLLEQGYKVVDVRDEVQYKRAHVKGSENVPLFVVDNDFSPATIVNRFVHYAFIQSLYGNEFTKPNENFANTFQQKYGKDAKLLLVCQSGLRSGAAVDQLENLGFENLAFLHRGLQDVKPGVLEKEGPKELFEAGKAGVAQYTPQISAVLGTILITLIAIIQFFPEQTAPTLKVIFEAAKENAEKMNGAPL